MATMDRGGVYGCSWKSCDVREIGEDMLQGVKDTS